MGLQQDQPPRGLRQDEPPRGLQQDQPPRGLQQDQPPRGLQQDQPPRGLQQDQPPRGLQQDQLLRGLQQDQLLRGLQQDQPPRGLQQDQPPRGLQQDQPPSRVLSFPEGSQNAQTPPPRCPSPPPASALPIAQFRDRITEHVRRHRVTCIQGETGCGKSTNVPLFLLDDWFHNGPVGNPLVERRPNIVVTQPRRVAATMLAKHVARSRGEQVGQTIGYGISRDVVISRDTCITFMTIGYFLQVGGH